MLNRRDAMIRLGQAGLGGLTLPGLLSAEDALRAGTTPSGLSTGTAKSCILLYLWGGPPQQDLWDLKPHAPEGIKSLFQPISTAVPGIHISDQLPLMAQHTDKMALVRSFSHHSNVHEVSVYYTLTGQVNNTLAVPRNQRNRRDFPNVASVVSYFSPPAVLPAAVTIPRPIGHDGVTYTGTYAGFLGPKYDPMELQTPGEVNGPAPHSLELLPGLDAGRLQARHGLLKLIEAHDRQMQSSVPQAGGRRGRESAVRAGAPATALPPARQTFHYRTPGFDRFREQAFRLLTAPQAKDAFKLEREPDQLRDQYGRNEYGESFLLARRLIEAGVRLVTVVWYYICPDGNVANVWDNHGGTGSLGGITGYEMLKKFYCLPSLDRAYSALLADLSDRGMLDETLLVMLGEFGRTPKINKTSGRDHWGRCQSIVLAGGGIQGGQVYGESDRIAAYPTKDAVSPEDLLATAYHALGIEPESTIPDQQHRPHHLTTGQPVLPLFG